MAVGTEMPFLINVAHPARHHDFGADARHLLHAHRQQAPRGRRRFAHQRKRLTPCCFCLFHTLRTDRPRHIPGRRAAHRSDAGHGFLRRAVRRWPRPCSVAASGAEPGLFFTPDALGSLFFVLLAAVSALVFIHSRDYLADCAIADLRRYAALQMLLTAAITGAYFANNVAVTWIFLEATTALRRGPGPLPPRSTRSKRPRSTFRLLPGHRRGLPRHPCCWAPPPRADRSAYKGVAR